MAEYIEREAAIKMIENDLPEQVRYYKQDAIDCLQCMPTADVVPKSEWISVDERLPDLCDRDPDWSVTVLFRTTQGHLHSGYRYVGRAQTSFYDDSWSTPYWLDESENLSFEVDEVTHWMPLPEAPKMEGVKRWD